MADSKKKRLSEAFHSTPQQEGINLPDYSVDPIIDAILRGVDYSREVASRFGENLLSQEQTGRGASYVDIGAEKDIAKAQAEAEEYGKQIEDERAERKFRENLGKIITEGPNQDTGPKDVNIPLFTESGGVMPSERNLSFSPEMIPSAREIAGTAAEFGGRELLSGNALLGKAMVPINMFGEMSGAYDKLARITGIPPAEIKLFASVLEGHGGGDLKFIQSFGTEMMRKYGPEAVGQLIKNLGETPELQETAEDLLKEKIKEKSLDYGVKTLKGGRTD